ncbi:MAG: aminotransferase class IV [Rhodospirillales bacterium]|nr:aminotransferase class IV [Rhodospirillales bacterium]
MVLDPLGYVAEISYTKLFYTKNDVIFTLVPNGTFLNGPTRQRNIQRVRDDGADVQERVMEYDDLSEADNMFGIGN